VPLDEAQIAALAAGMLSASADECVVVVILGSLEQTALWQTLMKRAGWFPQRDPIVLVNSTAHATTKKAVQRHHKNMNHMYALICGKTGPPRENKPNTTTVRGKRFLKKGDDLDSVWMNVPTLKGVFKMSDDTNTILRTQEKHILLVLELLCRFGPDSNGVVCDPMCGTGSVAMGCLRLNQRLCIINDRCAKVLPTAEVRLWLYVKYLLASKIITSNPGGLASVSDKTNEMDWLRGLFNGNQRKEGAVVPPHNVPWSFTGKQETVATMFPEYLKAHGLELKKSALGPEIMGLFTIVDRAEGDFIGPNHGTYRRRLPGEASEVARGDQRYVAFDGIAGVSTSNPLWLVTNQWAIGGLPVDGSLLESPAEERPSNTELVSSDAIDWGHPNKVGLFTTQAVAAGEELFCPRGNQFYSSKKTRKRAATFAKNKQSAGAHTHTLLHAYM
jgi:hypothetical protein